MERSNDERSSENDKTSSDNDIDKNENVSIDYDEILISVGGWGTFQKVLINAACLPVLFATVIMFNVTVFSAALPNFRCRIPECDVANGSYKDSFTNNFARFTIPANSETDQCYRYSFKGHNNTSGDQCHSDLFDKHEVTECTQWVYDKSVYETTFMSENNIVCKSGWKGPLSQSLFFFGVLLANFISGLLSDRFGRRHVVMICILLLALSSLAMIFARSYEFYLAMSFIIANAQAGLFLISFILTMELVGPSKRVFCGIIVEVFFNLGEILAPVLAYWQRDWRNVMIIATVPVFLFLTYWPVLPESVRWLLAKKKLAEAQRTTDRISHWNKTPKIDILQYGTTDDTGILQAPVGQETMLDLLKDPVLSLRLLNMCTTWLVIVLGYYGLSLTSVSLSGDPYLNFFLVSLVELPGYAIAWFCMEKFGRRLTMVGSLVSGGIALLAKGAVDLSGRSNEPFFFWFNLVAFMVGKCGLTTAFGAVYVYHSELFPTSIRSAGVGICSTCGRLGAIVTPWISDQAKQNPWIVMVIFGGSSVISGLFNLLLPETLGHQLPETLAQAKAMGRSTKELTLPDEVTPLLPGQSL